MRKIVLAGLILSSVLMAGENGVYVAGDISRATSHDKASDGSSYTNTSTAYGLDLGYYFDANSRAYAFYQYISKGDYAKNTNAYGAGYDYLFGNGSFKPFIGAIAAYSSYKNAGYTQDGFAYGGQVGVDYKVNNNIALDAGYRYLFSDAKGHSGSYTEETTYFKSFFAGINYKF